MEQSVIKAARQKVKRAKRVRSHLRGNAAKPRLSVVKTNKHVSAQLIDDEAGITLGFASTTSKEVRGTEFGKKNKTAAKALGERLAKIAKAKSIESAVFDRGASKYHGVVAAVAEGAREQGLKV